MYSGRRRDQLTLRCKTYVQRNDTQYYPYRNQNHTGPRNFTVSCKWGLRKMLNRLANSSLYHDIMFLWNLQSCNLLNYPWGLILSCMIDCRAGGAGQKRVAAWQSVDWTLDKPAWPRKESEMQPSSKNNLGSQSEPARGHWCTRIIRDCWSVKPGLATST